MENKVLEIVLAERLRNPCLQRPDVYQYLDNNRYCSCFKSSSSYYERYRGDGIDYHKVNNTIICPKHMEIYMRKMTELRIEKMEKTIDKMEKTLDTILSAIKYITYRVDRDKFEPEMNNLLGNITSEASDNKTDLK